MPLSWNEIRKRAIEFAQEYANATRENAETQSFYNDFFNVFGISRRRVASFEEPVKKLAKKRGRIDLFWKGVLLVEQKSTGRNLDAAYSQALDYFPNLQDEELPKYVLVSDFQRFELYDLETSNIHKFLLSELHKNVELFGFIAGYQKREFKDQDPVNIEASERMGKLHDMLKESGYVGHELELFLVRLLFCLFADDTGIFEKDTFQFYLEDKTKEDGSDLGLHLAMIFQTLNTSIEKHPKTLDESLKAFTYINGTLFADILTIPAFDSTMRKSLISACYFDWSRISPAIFGSLFQSVMDKDKRRGIGAHYTTEKNIMKILKPLFLDELNAEFEKIKTSKPKLQAFHDKLANLKFLDPACGCGNFLILAYRELRELEISVLKALYGDQLALDVSHFSRIDVDAFYGIEIEEFPAKIAEVALWLMDHQMNIRLSEAFGVYYVRLPLRKTARIIHGNALRIDWKEIILPNWLNYILGNPPFRGKKEQDDVQKSDMNLIFRGVDSAGLLDYVAAWYLKAAQYIQNTNIECAFVSTNSICQGEQVGILWGVLIERYNIQINFAHRTFQWSSEARKKAAVHCIIIGFATFEKNHKLLFHYDNPQSEPHEIRATLINPYLVDAPVVLIEKRSRSLCEVAEINKGSEATDFGHLILSETEKEELIRTEPNVKKWIREYVGGEEFINSTKRYCLWLVGIEPKAMKSMPSVMDRVKRVQEARQNSDKARTKEWAKMPTLFSENRQPDTDYLLIPKVSSERRVYLPIGFCTKEVIASGSVLVIPNASLYEFGILSSIMHNEWMRYTAGRMKSDYQYSSTIVYNNFPWPQNPTQAQIKSVETKAQAVLDARKQFNDSSLAALYDPLTMPPVLLKAHFGLDKAVDAAYRKQPFDSQRNRIEFLFGLYQQLTAPLIAATSKKKKK